MEFGVDYVGDDLTLVTNVTSYVKCQKLCQVKDLNKMSMLILLKVLRQIKLKKIEIFSNSMNPQPHLSLFLAPKGA